MQIIFIFSVNPTKSIIGELMREFLQKTTTKNDGKKRIESKPIETIKKENVRMLLTKIEKFSASYVVQSEPHLEVITYFFKAIFVPCLHLICRLPVENLWKTIIIVFNFAKALDEDKLEDVYFRLAYAKTPLSQNVGFPMKRDYKIEMKESAVPKNSTDGVWLLEKLSIDRKSSTKFSREKHLYFLNLLHSFKERDLIKLKADDFRWLIPDLWPQRITKITGGMPNSECYIGCLLYTSPSPRDS